ncbi:MAG: glycosyltransferase family 2 protein, partial [Chloroflexi bacterium]|nr:glycosyltransferase family 2 protein [Chloroflexota bacterium]
SGYGVELALSLYARRDGWPVASVLWPGVQHPRKTQKYGLVRGTSRYLRSLYEILRAVWVFSKV